MSKRRCSVLSVILTAAMLLAACAPAATSTVATDVPALPTTVPTVPAANPTTVPAASTATPLPAPAQPDDASIKVGLVTNTGGVNDHAFNQLAWEGIQQAAQEMGFQTKFVESQQPSDYENQIDTLATEGYTVIITVGSTMADATARKARQYPMVQFAIVDHAYMPTSGPYCADTVTDCYVDGGLTNVTSLMFAEGQVSFLAGVLAGGMSRSGFVCSVSSVPPPASNGYVINFRAGAVWQGGENMRGMNNYINVQSSNANIPTFADSTEGKETAQGLIDNGCDVVFGVAADGALLAASENNLMAIGADVDLYDTDPAVQPALLSTAMKHVDVAVYNYLKSVIDGSVTAGIRMGTLQNGGVGLAPFHDWNSRIPAELKSDIQQAGAGIVEGTITIELP
ncbi:MAG: hypothetical protein CL610_20200 [Anaerolineaceae bacterium]|nr:hypothetical protein [Anaerolineaceae bacterium]